MTTEHSIDHHRPGLQRGPTFTSGGLEREFTSKGYVVIPFLDAAEIRQVQELHDRLFPEVPLDFHSTFLSATKDQKLSVLTGIRQIIGGRLREILPRHTVRSATFITKRPASRRGLLPLHRDASMNDDQIEAAPNVWCPLVDVGPENACMRVVPCSHRLFRDPYPMNAHVATEALEDEFVREVPMRAGMAMIYDSRLVHGSGENTTDRARVAFNCVTIADGREPQLYFCEDRERGRIKVFEVTEAFLCGFQYGSTPQEPYQDGLRHIDTIDRPAVSWGHIDRPVLRAYQRDAGV